MLIDKILLEALNDRLELHEKMKTAYFYQSPGHASSRRSYEKFNSRELIMFDLDGHAYAWEQTTRCSCKHVYYSSLVHVDAVKKDVRAIKKARKLIASNVAEAMRKGAAIGKKK